MADKIKRPSKGSNFFIKADEWNKPLGIHTIMAHEISLQDAMEIAKKTSWNNIGYQKNLSNILSVYPNMSLGAANAFARMGYDQNSAAVKAGADLDTIQNSLRGFNSNGKYSSSDVMRALSTINVDPNKADLQDNHDAAWFSGLKSFSRHTFAMLTAPLQIVTQAMRSSMAVARKADEEKRFVDPFSLIFRGVFNKNTYTQNTFAKMLGGAESGQGYFAGGDALKQSEEAARRTLTIAGHNDIAWTLGRQIASFGSDDPNSTAFRTASGIVDGIVALFADPTVILGKAVAGARAAKFITEGTAATRAGTAAVTTTEVGERAKNSLAAARSLRDVSVKDLNDKYRFLRKQAIERDKLYVAGAGTPSYEAMAARYAESGVDALRTELDSINTSLKTVRSAIKSKDATIADSVLADMPEGITLVGARKLLEKARRTKNKDIEEKLIDIHGTPEERAIFQEAKNKYLQDRANVANQKVRVESFTERAKAFEEAGIGLVRNVDEVRLDRQKAIEWFAGKRGEDYLTIIANTDDARLINKMSKGKFGASLSKRLADAKNLDEVEEILLPRLGIDVNTMVPRNILGRYAVSRFPALVLRPVNAARVERSYNSLRSAIDRGLAKMPNGRYINFNDTDTLVEQTERWMTTAGFDETQISKIYNDLVNTSPDDFAARSRILFSTLDNAATSIMSKYNISLKEQARLRRSITSYETAVTGEFAYHSESYAGSSPAGMKIMVRNAAGYDEEIDLHKVANSASQLAQGIYLPDTVELRRMSGVIMRATRAIDRKLSKGEITTETARKMMSTARFINDDIFKTAVLVFRGAYIARNLLEMGVRQYLSGGRNVISNPVTYISMVFGNPKAAMKYLEKVGYKGDPFLVDGMGRPFTQQGFQRGVDQEWVDSFSNMMALRAVSSDARLATYATRQGGWKMLRLTERGDTERFAEGLADLLLRHRSDSIKRAIAGKQLPKSMQKLVDSGKMTFETAISRMVAEGKFRDMNMVKHSVPQVRRVLNSENGRQEFLFNHPNSLRNQIEHDTLGLDSLKNFIATGDITEGGKVVFSLSDDLNRNHRMLKKHILEQLNNDETVLARARQIEIPALDVKYSRGSGMREFVDRFFEFAARVDSKVIYSPEYRMAYWDRMSQIAPNLSRKAAESISSSALARDIEKTKIVDTAAEEVVTKSYMTHNPAYAQISDVANGRVSQGWMTAEEAHRVASLYASQHVASMFYDAAEKNNLTQALSLVLPFVNAWQDTLRQWGKFGASSTNLATRVVPASRLLQTLQSPESNVIYDIFGTPHDATQGFIYEDQSGNRSFTIPWSGMATTAFGALGNPKMNDIALSLNSLNLAFSGGQMPGSDVGLLPGVGPLVTFGYQSMTPNSWKYSMPGFIQHIIEPYGPKKGLSVLENLLPGWSKNIIFSSQPEALARMGQSIMAWELTSNDKYRKLFDGTALSITDRTALQNELTRESATMAKQQFVWQGIIKSISPGAPIYTYYAKNKNNDTFLQFQMANTLRNMIQQTGDFNVGWGMYAEMFGREAIMAATGSTTGRVFANSDAWDFATKNSDLMDAYIEEIPYFFAGGDFSTQYAAAMKARGKGRSLTTAEIMNEADSLMIAAVKGQLAIKAARYGYPPSWIDEQMKTYKMDVLSGYQPERPMNSGARSNRIARVIELAQDARIQQTAAGQGLNQWLPLYQSAVEEAQANGYKTLKSDDLAYMRYELDNRAKSIGQNNPDFLNLYNRVFSYEINQ